MLTKNVNHVLHSIDNKGTTLRIAGILIETDLSLRLGVKKNEW